MSAKTLLAKLDLAEEFARALKETAQAAFWQSRAFWLRCELRKMGVVL
jgi:hypothetical protein